MSLSFNSKIENEYFDKMQEDFIKQVQSYFDKTQKVAKMAFISRNFAARCMKLKISTMEFIDYLEEKGDIFVLYSTKTGGRFLLTQDIADEIQKTYKMSPSLFIEQTAE